QAANGVKAWQVAEHARRSAARHEQDCARLAHACARRCELVRRRQAEERQASPRPWPPSPPPRAPVAGEAVAAKAWLSCCRCAALLRTSFEVLSASGRAEQPTSTAL
ncbi:unnamed protein product, partial [Prorocentrum cordatum]